jgi:ABC-type branched-subunit amino acid transport system ATPase component
MASPIVRTERLTRSFGSLMAVAQVDFEVQRGEQQMLAIARGLVPRPKLMLGGSSSRARRTPSAKTRRSSNAS